MAPRIKHLIFRYHFLISLFLIIGVLVVYGSIDHLRTVEFLSAGIGGSLALSYFAFQYGMEERKFVRDLFADFNRRYNSMNESLFDISASKAELSDAEKKVLVDYFNLCAEEWFYFSEGVIPLPIWKSWLNGMNHYHAIDRIGKFWDEELKSDSYYGFRFQAF